MSLTRTGVLVRHNARLAARDPGPLISRLAMPVVMLVLLQPFYRATFPTSEQGITQATTGMMVMFSMLAVSIVGTAILNERLWHTWNRLRVTAARPVEILVGEVTCPFAIFLLQQSIVVILSAMVFDLNVVDPPLLVGAMVTWGITLLCCGALLGTTMRTPGSISAVQDVSALIFTAMGGVLVPLALLPQWVQTIAPLSPGYWGHALLRSAVQGNATQTVRAAAVLVVIAAITGGLACRRVTRGQAR
jgi:ABC-2 type transport system permease protein